MLSVVAPAGFSAGFFSPHAIVNTTPTNAANETIRSFFMRLPALAKGAPATTAIAVVLLTALVTIEEGFALAGVGSSAAISAATVLAVVAALPVALLSSAFLEARLLHRRAIGVVAVTCFMGLVIPTAPLTTRPGLSAVIGALGCLMVLAASVGGATLVRFLRSRMPTALVAMGAGSAIAIVAINRVLLPRLYSSLHLGLAALAVVACVVAAYGLAALRASRWIALLGAAIAAMFVATAPRAAIALSQCQPTRDALHERSELLRPIVKWTSRLVPPAEPVSRSAPDPLSPTPGPSPIRATGASVLLITIDALRADHVGAYGYARRPTTPNIDLLARDGVLFESAYTSAPQTSYAMTSMLTGQFARAVLDGGHRFANTWPALMIQHGYATAAFYPEAVFFTDRPRFAAFEDSHFGFASADVRYATADERVAHARAFIQAAKAPFFVWVHLFEPHDPYEASPDFPFGDDDLDRYDSEIAVADRAVGALVRSTRSARADTIIIVTADHGEAFGEHHSQFHGTTLYEEQVRVPLVVSAPWLFGPARRAEPVQNIDLMPTVLHAIGHPTSAAVRGRDLGSTLLGGEPSAGVAFASLPGASLLAVGRDRLICRHSIAVCSLFELDADPHQNQPSHHGARIVALRAMLHALNSANLVAE